MSKTAPTAHGLFISAAVLALPKLTLTARLVLAEILNLHRVTGNVFARDSHFAGRLNVGVRTVGTAIAELEAQGYLDRPYDPAARQKRTLVLAEKCLPILQGVVADSATSIAECLPILQPLSQNQPKSDCRNGNECLPILQGVVADSADINNTLNNNTNSLSEGAGVSAQNLASPASEPTSTPTANAEKKSAGKRAKKAGADFTEIAALLLPHPEPAFAQAWQTFYTKNTKQAGKPLTAFELMLKKLGSRPVGFAIVMLESAIQGDWSGVENPGTARAFATWQAEVGSRSPASAPTPTIAAEEEALDEPARLFRAQLATEAAERRKAHLARWSARPA